MSLPNIESNIATQFACGFGGYNGYYDFMTNPGTVQQATVHARFSFVYEYISSDFVESFTVESGTESGVINLQNNQPGWYIYSQQSSILPTVN